jgi:hypothetical protein
MVMLLLITADVLHPRRVDQHFAAEVDAAKVQPVIRSPSWTTVPLLKGRGTARSHACWRAGSLTLFEHELHRPGI